MIEAVTSAVSNAQLSRGLLEQIDSARIPATELQTSPSDARGDLLRAPYISPVVFVDLDYDTAVLQIRDSDTGDVVRQFPTEPSLRARQSIQVQEKVEAPVYSDSSGSAEPDDETGESNGSGGDVGSFAAQSQIASAALNASAKAGIETLSAGVSVVA